MRRREAGVELVRLRPHDHIGWVVSGEEQFVTVALAFLELGSQLGERLLYVAEDPDVATLLARTAPWGDALLVTSVAEVYGDSGVVEPGRQRAVFADVLAQAQSEGYSGIRVAADNTALVFDDRRLAAWMSWELVADRFMADNAVTGLCAFDRERVDVGRLRHLATLHPLTSARSPVPQFQMFADDGALRLEGEIDGFAIEQLRLGLRQLPPGTGVVVDLSTSAFARPSVLEALERLKATGVKVDLTGGP